jgi:hypothetical protein
MRRWTGGLLYLIGGALAGVASAYAMIQNAGVTGLGPEGPWLSRAAGQTGAAGIYVQSYYLLAGRLPAAPGQLNEAIAERDNEGLPLSAACIYVLTGRGAQPQWWSISALTPGGAATSRQSVVDAASAVREADGALRITAAREPQPGNWLRLPDGRKFAFHVIATPSAGRTGGLATSLRIERKGC